MCCVSALAITKYHHSVLRIYLSEHWATTAEPHEMKAARQAQLSVLISCDFSQAHVPSFNRLCRKLEALVSSVSC